MTKRPADEGKAVGVVCLNFSEAFGTVSHRALMEELAVHGLDGNALYQV